MAEPTGYTKRGLFSFTPSIQIDEALTIEVQSNVDWSDKRGFIAIDTGTDPGLDHGYPKLPTWGKINEEIVEIVSLVDDPGGAGQTVVINRGVLDTVPQEHVIGSILWFAGDWIGVDKTEWSSGETVWAKAALVGPSFTTPLDKVIPMPLPITGRAALPYPPGQFKINGSYWPASTTGDVVITWAHRDRLQQTSPDSFIDQTDGDVGPEAGTTYRLTAYNDTQGYSVLDEDLGAVTTYTFLADGTDSGSHAYWRIIVDDPEDTTRISIVLIEMRDAVGGATLCIGGTATASSYLGSHVPARAFDTSDTTLWSTDDTAAGGDVTGEWIQYQFSSPQTILEIMFKAYTAGIFMTGWTVQYSDDGIAWSDAGSTTGETPFIYYEERAYIYGVPGWDDADELTITLGSTRDSLDSHQDHEHTFTANHTP